MKFKTLLIFIATGFAICLFFNWPLFNISVISNWTETKCSPIDKAIIYPSQGYCSCECECVKNASILPDCTDNKFNNKVISFNQCNSRPCSREKYCKKHKSVPYCQLCKYYYNYVFIPLTFDDKRQKQHNYTLSKVFYEPEDDKEMNKFITKTGKKFTCLYQIHNSSISVKYGNLSGWMQLFIFIFVIDGLWFLSVIVSSIYYLYTNRSYDSRENEREILLPNIATSIN